MMRDGKMVQALPREGLDEKKLIRRMIGHDITNLYPRSETTIGEVVLRASNITRAPALHDCSFEVRAGEVLGFAGLAGAGRTELARAIFGADRIDAGEIWLDGCLRRITSPGDAIAAGIGYLTADQKKDGLALTPGSDQNITLVNLLSGGNQQKAVMARWLQTRARVLFFAEPTRGVGVRARAEIFALIDRLAGAGRAIVLISSYLWELLTMSDRIVVFREGHIAGALQRDQFSEERITALAAGAEEIEAV